jgi:hypothetical protein
MEHYTEKERKVQSVEQFPTILVNDGRVKDPTDVANAFDNFFITITEKIIVQPIEKGAVISILEYSLLETFPA